MDCTNKKSALGGAGDHAKHGGGGIGDSRYFAGLSNNNGSQDKHGVTASQSFKVAMTSERPVRTGSDIFFAHLTQLAGLSPPSFGWRLVTAG